MDTQETSPYPPLSDEELDAWEARARGPKDWTAADVLRLIADARRLRKAQVGADEGIRIVRDPTRCGGDPILAGTRTAVHDVFSYSRLHGGDLEEVRQELPHLSMEQIQAALADYAENPAEIDDILRRRREFVESLPVAPTRK